MSVRPSACWKFPLYSNFWRHKYIIQSRMTPGWLQDDQGWPQDDSRMTLDDPRMTPGWPRISPGWPRMTKEDLRMTKDDPRMTSGWPQDDPGMTQYDSRMTQNNSRMTQAPAQAPPPAPRPIFLSYKKIQKVPNRNSEIAKYCAIWWNWIATVCSTN